VLRRSILIRIDAAARECRTDLPFVFAYTVFKHLATSPVTLKSASTVHLGRAHDCSAQQYG